MVSSYVWPVRVHNIRKNVEANLDKNNYDLQPPNTSCFATNEEKDKEAHTDSKWSSEG